MLQHAYIYGHGSEDKWRRWIDTLADIEGLQRTPPGGALLTQQIQIYHDKHPLPEINRMEIENIVVPSMLLLRAWDLGQHRTAQLFSDKVDHMRRLYYDLVVDPATVVEKHSGITVTDMVALLESFNLLQPVRDQGKWKCNCKEFFRDGICTHTTLFTMLWYPNCQVPDEYSAVKIPTRPSSRRPGVFSNISAEPTFKEMTPRDRVWAPSGMAGGIVGFDNTDDVELPPEKDSVSRLGGLRKSNAALPSIPRKSIPAGWIERKAQFARDSVLNPSPAQPQTHAPPSTPGAKQDFSIFSHFSFSHFWV